MFNVQLPMNQTVASNATYLTASDAVWSLEIGNWLLFGVLVILFLGYSLGYFMLQNTPE